MRLADDGDRQAAQFILERRFPEEWSEKVKHTVTTALDDALEALEQEFREEPEVLVRIARALGAEGADSGAGSQSEREALH